MNRFDTSVETFFNQFAHRWVALDNGVSLLDHGLFKAAVPMMVLWWLWFRSPAAPRTRGVIVCMLAASLAAILLARALAVTLPFRDRPLYASGFTYRRPYDLDITGLEGWSSFPSDHAVLFFALSAGFFRLSRPLGVAAAIYSLLFVVTPRLYLGFHWPTDMLAGAALGIAVGWTATSDSVRLRIAPPVLRLSERFPEWLYPAAFLLTYQLAETFEDLRLAAHYVLHTAKDIL